MDTFRKVLLRIVNTPCGLGLFEQESNASSEGSPDYSRGLIWSQSQGSGETKDECHSRES